MAAHAERKKPKTQTKKSGGVNVQRDTMENIVMVRNSEGLVSHILCTAASSPPPHLFSFWVERGAVIHRLSVSVIPWKKSLFQF